eukprot:2415620-Pyramimonas_sp.AAC.1
MSTQAFLASSIRMASVVLRGAALLEGDRFCEQRILHDRLLIEHQGGPPSGVDEAAIAQGILVGPLLDGGESAAVAS